MRTLILFLLAILIAAGALLTATKMEKPGFAFAVAFGVWFLFMGYLMNRRRD